MRESGTDGVMTSVDGGDRERLIAERISRMQILAESLGKRAEQQVILRQTIEDRWVEDIRQYNGQYSADIVKRFKPGASAVFVNITRPKTNAAIASMSDMLFPTDDRNFSIKPTPVPEMIDEVEKNRLQQEAERRAELMQAEIDDQLSESNYNHVGRQVIHDGCVVGTGVIKGPVILGRSKKQWQEVVDGESGASVMVLNIVAENTPSVQAVDPFNFFPDMSAATLDDAEFVFERHYMSHRNMVKLARTPGFFADQINMILKGKQYGDEPRHYTHLRDMTGTSSAIDKNRYIVWEYHGPISKDDLIACGCDISPDDEMDIYEGVVFFCNGHVIKADINPMDTAERPYSVWCFEPDEACVFGYSVPYLLRNPQSVINATWRMVMDNGGLSVGPQIVINPAIIQPAPVDGKISWSLESRKVWELVDKTRSVSEAFGAFHIQSNLRDLKEIFMMARQLCDEETGLPLIAQGEQNANITQTASGMEMLMNSSNVVKRRGVKYYDDNVTVPLIGRFYDHNMQFSGKPEIKGDFNVMARGASSLLIKETQARNMLNLMQFAHSPALAPLTKWPEAYRKLIDSHQLDADEIVKSDDEMAQQQPAQAQDDGMVAVKMRELDLSERRHNDDVRIRLYEIGEKMKLGYADIAVKKGIKMEELARRLGVDMENLTMAKNKFDLDVIREMEKLEQRALQQRELELKASGQIAQGV